jgi:competence protein ComEC
VSAYPALVVALGWCAAIAAAVVLIPMQPWLGVVAIAAAVPVLALAIFVRPALIAITLAAALLGVGRAELPPADLEAHAKAPRLAGVSVVITGRVADDARAVGGGAEALIEPLRVTSGATDLRDIGNLLVRWRSPDTPNISDRIRAAGKLVLPRDLPGFDRRAYLAQRSVYLELQASSFEVIASERGVASLPALLRSRYSATLDGALPAPHAAVLLGIVLGIRQGIPADLQKALIATGLIHLLVLSGLKVAVFARMVQGALVPVLGRFATWPALALIALYALVGGATPAALRASAMGGLAIAAAHLGRPSHVWTSLSVTAAAMLGWHPELAWDVGFQLSFAGTAAIILLTPGIAARVGFLPHIFREPFAVTCAAQIGTLPMMATDFHVFSPVAPIANALTLPILPFLVAAGLALGALSFAPVVPQLVGISVAGLLLYVEQVANVLARVPSAAIPIPTFPSWLGLGYYSALGPAIAGANMKGGRRKGAFAAAAIAPILISATALAAWAGSPPQVAVLDVGDGQAVLLRGPHGTVLIDGGPSPARLEDALGTQLPPWQRALDVVVITAPGLGHVGGLAGFDRTAGAVLVPTVGLTGTTWRTVALEQAARGARVEQVGAGTTLEVAGFRLEVLAPERGAPGDEAGAADMALRVLADDGRSFCDFSDLDLDGQTLAALRLSAACTYVLLPSGGRSRLSPDLERRAVTARTQLVASRTAGRLAAGLPADVLRTDQEGTITLPM